MKISNLFFLLLALVVVFGGFNLTNQLNDNLLTGATIGLAIVNETESSVNESLNLVGENKEITNALVKTKSDPIQTKETLTTKNNNNNNNNSFTAENEITPTEIVTPTSSDSQNLSEWRMDGRNLNATFHYPGPIPGDISDLDVKTYAAGATTGDPTIANGFLYAPPLRLGLLKLNA